MLYLAHVLFAAFLVCLIYAINKQGEHLELLVRGLEEARRIDSEAARIRLATAMEAQQEATDKVRKLVEESQCAIRRSEGVLRAGLTSQRERGSAQVATGHEGKKGL